MDAELYALQETGMTARLFNTMPRLLSLYHAVMQDMTEADIALLRANSSSAEKSAVLCRVLTLNKQELLEVLQQFETISVCNDGTAERRAMERVGSLDACDAFLERTAPIDKNTLLNAIEANAAMPQNTNGDLRTAIIAYLRAQMPYLAFALSEREGS